MNLLQASAIALAGLVAGVFTAVVGAGTLITFPVMLAMGYPPVVANVSTDLGLVPGSVSSAVGFRRELAGQWPRVRRLGIVSTVGAVGGAALLLLLPPTDFKAAAPALVALSLILVVGQPRITAWLTRRSTDQRSLDSGVLAITSVFAVALYGGYFGGGQGVLALGVLAVMLPEPLHRVNAVKVVLVMIANTVSGIVFILIAHVAWQAVLLIAVGSTVGGFLGARIGRRLSPVTLRAMVVLVGIASIVKLVT